jgi:hypothetical protein
VKNRHVKYLLYTYFLIQLLPVLLDINALYPYQGSYFNRTYGGLKVARAKQEIYPRLEEGVKWLEAKIPPGAVIEIPGRSPTGNSPVGGERATGTGGYYKVVNVTGDYLDPRPDCVTVHSIYRQKTPLILIKKC